ncbi:sulfur carrier protein [Thermanaeromonas toyohensis ToBE]|uniref:Sulfur carrier protein n=1 Tax=Thermanaeromonas toyohensis ToBE TaxID=698762 RepID=A0A1W1VIA8_9FIRM|nr:sulfur carrier protein ThiS [Thermanaeromonas toyohensis]SMB92781.1 sulfur carrier protein [Thermanaeromonas toyohensis ToBE]
MEVLINGEKKEVKPGTTIGALLRELGVDYRYLAVERNRAIVPKQEYDQVVLEEGDEIEIVRFVGGG